MWKTTQTTGTTILKWQPAFRLVKVVFVVVNRQHRVHNQTVVPVVSVVVKTKAQKIIDKSERLVETRYCLTGSRMGTTYPRASPPVTTALPPYGQWVQGQISLSTALQAGLYFLFIALKRMETFGRRWCQNYGLGVKNLFL